MVDGYCIGSSAPYVFFYTEVLGDRKHRVSSKFAWEETPDPDNHLFIEVKSGMHYFLEQYLLGGTGLDLVDEEEGKEKVSKLDMATKGRCGRTPASADLHDGVQFGRGLCGLFSGKKC